MSRRKSKTRSNPRLGDWNVTFARTAGGCVIASSWFTRDKRGGYTFYGEAGVAYDFPPGSVAYVRRVQPAGNDQQYYERCPPDCKWPDRHSHMLTVPGQILTAPNLLTAPGQILTAPGLWSEPVVAGHVTGTDDD